MTNMNKAASVIDPHPIVDEAESKTSSLMAKLPQILRILGSATLIAAVSIFLFQGWESGNDTYRFLLLLGHTVGIAVIGFLSGQWIKEGKGARLLLALSLVFIPANFAILGGFVYSQFALDASHVVYPQYLFWHAQSATTALTTAGIAVAALAPVMLLGFMVLSRRSARAFTFTYMVSNLALLAPVRDASIIGCLIVSLALVIAVLNGKAREHDLGAHTFEGIVARVLQYVPIGILAGRSLWLYSADVFLMTALAIVVYVMMRHLALLMQAKDARRSILEVLSMLPAVVIAAGSTSLMHDVLPTMFTLLLPVFSIVLSALTLEIASRAGQGSSTYRRLAALIVTGGIMINLLTYGGVLAASLGLGLGLGLLIYGYIVEQKAVFAMGLVSMLAGLGYQVSYLVEVFNLGGWGGLVALGVSAILAASILERDGDKIRTRLTHWHQQFRSWQY